MEGDAALGFPNKVTHMRSSGPGPNPLSLGVGGNRQDKTQDQVPGEKGCYGQQWWGPSGLGPMRRMPPTPTVAFGSWLLPS